MFGKIETEATLHAQEILVIAREVAVVGAQNFVVANAQRCFASVRTMRAYGRDVFHLPGARLVAIRAAGESADGADIDAHTAFFAVEMVLPVRDNYRLRAALAHAERLDVHSLVANANAAETQYAARRIVIDRLGPFLFRLVACFVGEPVVVGAIGENHILQFALATLVAYRAIERVVGEQEFEHRLARLMYLLGTGAHNHAWHGEQRARGLQLGRFFDFHQAHAAGRLQREAREVAKRRHF